MYGQPCLAGREVDLPEWDAHFPLAMLTDDRGLHVCPPRIFECQAQRMKVAWRMRFEYQF
jgi:hypothetical protein